MILVFVWSRMKYNLPESIFQAEKQMKQRRKTEKFGKFLKAGLPF
jgi:hypothetical protein